MIAWTIYFGDPGRHRLVDLVDRLRTLASAKTVPIAVGIAQRNLPFCTLQPSIALRGQNHHSRQYRRHAPMEGSESVQQLHTLPRRHQNRLVRRRLAQRNYPISTPQYDETKIVVADIAVSCFPFGA
jgi:hypothetical protein